jgi:hypothetical protein
MRPAMLEILDSHLNLTLPLGQHRHCLVAQIPNDLRRSEQGYVVAEPDRQWRLVRSVVDLAAEGDGSLKKLHFLVLPEGCLSVSHLDDMLSTVDGRMRPNTVTLFGLEHMELRTYRRLLARFREDNARAGEMVDQDVDGGSSNEKPVNVCCIAVKEDDGRLRVFLEAKGHPFHGEEFLDKDRDLYQGRHCYFFRGHSSFNFMVLICLDYLYRDLYSSNMRRIVDHANRLYFDTRQTLDALFVVQCNPKPEHPAYRDVLSGFYGEYLEDTPGVRDTVTVFGNCSEESAIEGSGAHNRFGASSVVIGNRHRLGRVALSEFSTDDFGGAPLCRLRFGTSTRLYYFNLPLHHELDPRSYRIPLKVHYVLRRSGEDTWQRLTSDEMLQGAVMLD